LAAPQRRPRKKVLRLLRTAANRRYVLLTIEDYRRLTGGSMTLAEALAQRGDVADFDYDPPRVDGLFKPADFG
jgi:hypothetical protein